MRYGSDSNRPFPSRSERSSGHEIILTGLEYSLCRLRCRGFDILFSKRVISTAIDSKGGIAHQIVLRTSIESVKENMDWLKGTVR